ncbi:hypothetical protein EGW08_008606 [Elysia chlorotica]|uniref:Uncharacterized protein n=1 Tax=Elysia chlorotica TaxID=188477 RepID=A0A3S1C5N4_ELYCH|nr:hypothetical protein EGW08_008606 [Elysia chlorotica]
MDEECCYTIDRHCFFPYKRVIVGSKMTILPLRDSRGRVCGFDPSEVQGTSDSRNQDGRSCGCPSQQSLANTTRYECSTVPALPVMGGNTQLPLSSTLKKALAPRSENKCLDMTPLQTLTATKQMELKQQLRARIAHMEAESQKIVYRTPMSAFPNDFRTLKKAYRNYKRDVQLQKERGTFKEKPKHFYDEGTKKWYTYMVSHDKPSLDRTTQGLVNQTDCVTFADGAGGSCFVCPERDIPCLHK